MTVTYLDTSAILRLVEGRGDHSLVDAALAASPVSSILAWVETWTVFHKKCHDQEIAVGERDRLLHNAQENVFAVLSLLSLDGVVDDSRSMAERFPLRTLDALHLATAAITERRARRRGAVLRFCTADSRQAAAAEALFGSSRVDLVPGWR